MKSAISATIRNVRTKRIDFPWMLIRPLTSSSSLSSTTTKTPSSSSSIIVPQVLEAPVSPSPALKGMLVDLYERYSPTEIHKRKQLAEQFFQAARFQAVDPIWFGPGRVPRHFRNRHAMLTMHVWFLNKRLVSDTYDPDFALSIQNELFDILWDDTRCRIRQAGIQEMLVYKNLRKVQEYTLLHLAHYDHVYTELLDKPFERFHELKRLLARHVLLTEDDRALMNEEEDTSQATSGSENEVRVVPVLEKLMRSKNEMQLDCLAWYVDAQYQNIALEWPDDYYRDGRVAWIAPPDFTGLLDNNGKRLPDNPVDPNDVLPMPWRSNMTLKGEVYYWNPETRESLWERPT